MEQKIDFSQIPEAGLAAPTPPEPEEKPAPIISEKTPEIQTLPEEVSSSFPTREKVLSPEMSYPIPSPFEPKEEDLELPGENSSAALPPPEPTLVEQPTPSVGTDEDLIEALLPLVESSLEKALYAPQTGLHTYLEPMLRSTVRRAIACLLYTSPSPRDRTRSRMPSSA